MRLKNYLQDQYIGLVDKKTKSNQPISRETKNLLKELNNLLQRYDSDKNLKFDIVTDYTSPSEILQGLDENKLERITRKWMKLSNKFEELKDKHLTSWQQY